MMVGMLVAGFGLLLAGLLAIGYGIQYKEFSVGSTLILSGVFGFCTGLIVFGLWLAVRELRNLAQRLGTGMPAELRPEFPLPPVTSRAAAAPAGGLPFTRDQPAAEDSGGAEPVAPAAGAATPPWYHEAAARDRARNEVPPVAPPVAEPSETASAAPKRRNLMFSSTRKERERAQPRAGEPLTPDPALTESGEPQQQVNFDDTWPRSERQRPSDLPPRRPFRTPSGESPSAPLADHRSPQPQEQPPVTVLKSGVVDGMAYSLYSDGSIEAQMPEGMMRFASIDELRAHLDQRSS
ncbi:DUF308 domain-containing protein [Bradyrhizobium sp. USDA 10063]